MSSEKSGLVRRVLKTSLMSCALLTSLSFGTLANAEANGSAEAAPEASTPAVKPPPPRYSLPWMMRPVAAANVLRLDMTFATSKVTDTQPILLLASYKIRPNLAAIVRYGFIHNAPVKGEAATSFINPAIGALYAIPINPNVKASLFAAAAIPIGQGGGNDPNAARRAANLAGIFARASMDNALFQINYLTPIVGADIAFIGNDLTLQAEATLLELIRVKGEKVDKDATRTNLVFALHAGYFPIPQLSFGAELRYQYWASNGTIEKKKDDRLLDNWTFAFGPRAHFKLTEKMWVRPGVSLTLGLDSPTGFADTGSAYKLVQVDVPFIF